MLASTNKLAVNAAIERLISGEETGWLEAAQVVVDAGKSIPLSAHKQGEIENHRRFTGRRPEEVEVRQSGRYTATVGRYTLCHISDDTGETRFVTVRLPSTAWERAQAGEYVEYWIGYDVLEGCAYILARARWEAQKMIPLGWRFKTLLNMVRHSLAESILALLSLKRKSILVGHATTSFRLAECIAVHVCEESPLNPGDSLR